MNINDQICSDYFYTLKKKKALITGASSGIGECTAYLLAREGCDVTLVARREEKLKHVQMSIMENWPHCHCTIIAGDVNSHETLERVSRQTNFQFDIFVNNAGLALGLAPVIEAEESDWDDMIQTNIAAAFKWVRKVAQQMVQAKSGHIVNLTSVASHTAYENGSVYCATKHALLAFAQALREETCGHKVRVTNISPGMTKTEFSLTRFKGDAQRASDVYEGMVPLDGLDVAYQILYALKAPPHVNIDEIYLTPLAQGAVTKVHREGPKH